MIPTKRLISHLKPNPMFVFLILKYEAEVIVNGIVVWRSFLHSVSASSFDY